MCSINYYTLTLIERVSWSLVTCYSNSEMIRSADIMGGMLSSTTIQNYKKVNFCNVQKLFVRTYGLLPGFTPPHTTVTEKAFCWALSTVEVQQ